MGMVNQGMEFRRQVVQQEHKQLESPAHRIFLPAEQGYIPNRVTVGVTLRCRTAFFLRQKISRCIVGVGIGCRNIAGGIAASIVVDLACKLILTVIGVLDQRVKGTGALANLDDVAKGIVDILLALEQCSGAVADIAELDLRGGAAAADRAVGIRENAP